VFIIDDDVYDSFISSRPKTRQRLRTDYEMCAVLTLQKLTVVKVIGYM